MKLLYSIVRTDNVDEVCSALTNNKFYVTRLATTGGFLKKGNVTLMSCIEDERIDECIEVIKSVCGERKTISVDMPVAFAQAQVSFATVPKKVEIGGATIIIQNVENYLKF